jgi:hypothetical protein
MPATDLPKITLIGLFEDIGDRCMIGRCTYPLDYALRTSCGEWVSLQASMMFSTRNHPLTSGSPSGLRPINLPSLAITRTTSRRVSAV